uniref:Fatty acid desaturase domain-containing protein n=1 Tax=Chromera velia CCMP2878 TaxID=1169474 RepID=A0A0G4FZ88_9ALVE|eukprot:Cvel_19509.t1-p1 / transcript=Cvel_19509.t1 / gene=Cvel_19509 / organism=Chromera_velia_CCMP2878 / gene_product=Delta-9 acyl-lipid desaturase 1, putative / transcript_product=Delta-9 acyl-lipid desaturase 1, putative / location=Cvel_scaffold1688:8996-10401(-) / protein_length=387 / sequence_SO=supercontig / SO=protein_coding / is_pseudo=false
MSVEVATPTQAPAEAEVMKAPPSEAATTVERVRRTFTTASTTAEGSPVTLQPQVLQPQVVRPAVVPKKGGETKAGSPKRKWKSKRENFPDLNTPYDIAIKFLFGSAVVTWPILLILSIDSPERMQVSWLITLHILSWLKVGVGMSIVLHRFFAHQSFTCSRPFAFFLGIIGCLAGQRSPLWWASKHRVHHQNSDLPSDPHSPVQMGFWRAFLLWTVEPHGLRTDTEVLPKNLLTWELILLERLYFLVPLCEYFLWWKFMGWGYMLKVGVASSCICQGGSLFFNVLFHENDEFKPVVGHASNTDVMTLVKLFLGAFAATLPLGLVNPVHLLGSLSCLTFYMVGEHAHEDHHRHPALAKRGGFDPLAVMLLPPLKAMGLVNWAPSNWRE